MESELSLHLYNQMYLIRRAEEFIIQHYPDDEMKTPMHMSMGQEAVAVGVCHALGADGQVFSTYRSHALFLAMTGDSERFFGELYGKATGTARGKAGSMHLASPDHGLMTSSAIVGSNIPLAVGAAFANKQQANGKISCAYFGDGALGEGVFWESLNAACVMRLPVLFVCEDNGLSIDTKPQVRQGFKNIADVVGQFDASVFQDDSTDVEVLSSLANKAIEVIKEHERPSFLHLKCYRYLSHVGTEEDFQLGYRSRDEYEEWLERDPLLLQRNRLLSKGWTESTLAGEESKISARLEECLRRAQAAPFPNDEELYSGVFHEED